MFGKRNQKKEIVRIDVDWLLGESSPRSQRGFPWFQRISLSLLCVLAVVWCWPYASRHWLDWEWHQQLARSLGGSTEDVLPIMLAIHELNPKNDKEMIEHLGGSNASQRNIAYRLLEERIQQLRNAPKYSPSEITSLIETLCSNPMLTTESQWMRAQLVAQIKPLVNSKFPNAAILLASIDAMISEGELSQSRNTVTANTASLLPATASSRQSNPIKLTDSSSGNPVGQFSHSATPVVQAQFRLSDTAAPNQSPAPTQASVAKPPLKSSTDPSTSISQAPLPNLSVSIPRTNSNSMIVAMPPITVQPMDSAMSAAETPVTREEPSTIKGIEKLELEKLLPLLNSPQTRMERQAFNEMVRRNIPEQKLELAMALAHGENDEKFQAMDAIARDPQSAIPWLAWMASNTDRSVRRHAIALLCSMTDPDAMRRLRELQSKESDTAISDQINQVLLAYGMANKVIR